MSTRLFSPRAGRQAQCAAATRTEVVVIVVVALALAGLLLALGATVSRTRSQRVRCLSNLRQVMGALSLYTHDNQDLFPPNPDDSNMFPGYNWCPGDAGIAGSEQFNPDILAQGRYCLVASYLQSNAHVFHCTLDWRTGSYRGSNPAKKGTLVPSARTISMNGAVGTVDPLYSSSGGGHSGKPTLSVNGPWLSGAHDHRRTSPWRTYGKTSEIVAPIPAKLFVLTEENPYSLNDASFSVGMNSAVWIDWPGTLHERRGVLAFADGHAECHEWVDPRTVTRSHLGVRPWPPSVSLSSLENASPGTPVPNSPDWLWLSARTSAKAH
jgi:hypothetical protein